MIFPEYVTVKCENEDRPDNGLWVWSTIKADGFTTRSHQIFASYDAAVETAEYVAKSQRMTFRHTVEKVDTPDSMAEIQRRSMIARMCSADARQSQFEGDNVDRIGWQWLRDVITLENAANAQFFCVPQDIYVDVDGTQDWQIDGRW